MAYTITVYIISTLF